MRAPAFWDRPPGLAAWLLSPLGALYAQATRRRLARGPRHKLPVPVICVGNLTAGGAGKTPTVIALVQRLTERGMAAQIVSRGYGGRTKAPLRVDARRHKADMVGDEPLLLAAFAPVWVGEDRLATARAAAEDGAQVILLDDGYQDPSLAHDLSLVVADAETGFGNGFCLPAGPLREPVAVGLGRADLLLTIGAPAAQARFDSVWGARITTPRLQGQLAPLQMGFDWDGHRVFAFAGIGRPQKFFDTLSALGADVVGAQALDDHQPLAPALLARLEAEALARGAQLVTTEKDAVRLPASFLPKVMVLPVRLELDDATLLDAALDRIISG